MPNVTYVEPTGTARTIDVPLDENVMRGATDYGIESIVGECGGGLACATCHCYVDEAWIDRIPPASGDENDMLESVADDRRPNSRLSCQIVVTADLDGLSIHLPDHQY